MKTLFFLSGLPRSGSTLLGSILSQNPNIYCTPTSPLSDLLVMIDRNFFELNLHYTYQKEQIAHNTYSSILSNFYKHIEKPYVIDKHRAWCRNIGAVEAFTNKQPKVIATNRRIPEVISSYISLIQKNKDSENFVDNHLKKLNKEITTDNRVDLLWKEYISDPYESLVFGLKYHRNNIHLVDYQDLTDDPKEEMEKIYEFLDLPNFDHDFQNILNTCAEEKDDAWGLKGLHDIRSSLKRTNSPPEEIIGVNNTILYDKFNI